jgi:hypothetical protein
MRKHFDGYNNIIQYRMFDNIELVRYCRDEFYCGDDNVFSVRLYSTREDIQDFKTFIEALSFYKKCVKIINEKGISQLLPTLYPTLLKQ